MSSRIVVLDGYTLNPGDLDWGGLERLGALTVYDRTEAGALMERAAGVPVLLTNKTGLDARALGRLSELRYVGVLATGYNVVDAKAARERGVVVTNVPTYGTDSVAQHTMALMLELARGVGLHDRAVHEGRWSGSVDWCFAVSPIFELTGKTLGIVGLGRIGAAVARLGLAMGMKVVASGEGKAVPEELKGRVVRVSVDELFAGSDVVSLHCPLTAETERLVDGERLKRMKRSAYLINTSRGQLVDGEALAEALREGRLAGAAVDVLEKEPPGADHPLLSAPRCVVTPHVAWYAREARRRLLDTAVENVRAFLDGRPVNVVN